MFKLSGVLLNMKDGNKQIPAYAGMTVFLFYLFFSKPVCRLIRRKRTGRLETNFYLSKV